MNFDKIVEAIIREAQERGDFDNLKGKGKPIDLSAYFETPEDLRMVYSMLKNAGMVVNLIYVNLRQISLAQVDVYLCWRRNVKSVSSGAHITISRLALCWLIRWNTTCMLVTSADEYPPKPIQHPQTRRRDDLIRVHPIKASGYHNT